MLAEALEYLITPCPGWARRGGYLYWAIALSARHRRCREAWRPHAESCRRLILAAAARCSGRRRVVVLGSGLLVEVPAAELAARFDEVVLVDAVHLWPVRRLCRRWPNLRLLTCDLTGVVPDLLAGEGIGPVPAGPPAVLAGLPCDLVVSANLLSQLPMVPLEILRNRRPPVDEETFDRFAAALIRRHLEWLPGLAEVSCLITDVERLSHHGGVLVERADLLFGIELPPPDLEWHWDLAPSPEAHPLHDWSRRVVGLVSDTHPDP